MFLNCLFPKSKFALLKMCIAFQQSQIHVLENKRTHLAINIVYFKNSFPCLNDRKKLLTNRIIILISKNMSARIQQIWLI